MPATRGCCADENVKRSAHSASGPVDDDETLIRILYKADQVDPDGYLSTAVIQREELKRIKDGFSLDRLRHLSPNEYAKSVDAFVNRRVGNAYVGAAVVTVAQLRSIVTKAGAFALCVVDDGLASPPEPVANPAHALAHCADHVVQQMQQAAVTVGSKEKQAAGTAVNVDIQLMREEIVRVIGKVKTPQEIETMMAPGVA